MSTSLEARLDAIESRFAIDTLIANYAEAFDTMNEELLATLWHPESRLLLGANGNSEGLEAILAQARVNMKRMPHMHHWMANALIKLDGDHGSGLVAADCIFYDVDQGPLQVSGQYRDVYERRDGRWAFLERTFTMHYAVPLQNWVPVMGTERFGRSA
ncbi:nuclear transport factor 2 family protein [Paucibacter sp. R3-3]|uniref:Nuclear transport factor 2 family protein n=1 Tax=Roseateles agri TaxID=3098619 RepID=A0ABU5DMW4_9BURK|nr:nuclear transport factor 2 family protein [Paucibacter sp. R3-3]MDY0747632.1 nuclear transport factor 2 family protein [Paucibacter sp. R3-3]